MESDLWSDPDGGTPLGKYLYHYTRPETASLVLGGSALRMGPLWETNDPRETGEWFPAISRNPDDGEVSNEEWWHLINEVDAAMRKCVYLACFTEDREPYGWDGGQPWHFHRGWARPRMWQQYAQEHTGVCLILDRRCWITAVDSVRDSPVCATDAAAQRRVHGPVVYEDRPVGSDARTLVFGVGELRRLGPDGVGRACARENAEELFLRKSTDWESEREFRSLVIGAIEPLLIPIETSIRGIVVGERCSPELTALAQHYLATRGLPDAVSRCRWEKGAPQVVPT